MNKTKKVSGSTKVESNANLLAECLALRDICFDKSQVKLNRLSNALEELLAAHSCTEKSSELSEDTKKKLDKVLKMKEVTTEKRLKKIRDQYVNLMLSYEERESEYED